jgi:2-polyprenyl-3-methyl-5-hydroxy-6-metoxy-1,4-benzoquinol methylase
VSVEDRVRSHFDADAERFDAIYDDERKGPLSRWIDNVWRGVVRRRFDLTLDALEPLAGKSVLDVGCGSGRYCLAFADRGASRIVGVDLASAMIDLAVEHAEQAGVGDRCEFRVGRFPEDIPDGPFDSSTALGFFDYVDDPVRIAASMRELTRETMVMSFPKAREWRAPIRRLRFLVSRCPLFLYTEGRVKEILAEAGVERFDWTELDRDYLVVAHLR